MTTPTGPRDEPIDGPVRHRLWRLRARLVTPPPAQRVQADLDRLVRAARDRAHVSPSAGANASPSPLASVRPDRPVAPSPDAAPADGTDEPEGVAAFPAMRACTDVGSRRDGRWLPAHQVTRVAAAAVVVVVMATGVAGARDGGLTLQALLGHDAVQSAGEAPKASQVPPAGTGELEQEPEAGAEDDGAAEDAGSVSGRANTTHRSERRTGTRAGSRDTTPEVSDEPRPDHSVDGSADEDAGPAGNIAEAGNGETGEAVGEGADQPADASGDGDGSDRDGDTGNEQPSSPAPTDTRAGKPSDSAAKGSSSKSSEDAARANGGSAGEDATSEPRGELDGGTAAADEDGEAGQDVPADEQVVAAPETDVDGLGEVRPCEEERSDCVHEEARDEASDDEIGRAGDPAEATEGTGELTASEEVGSEGAASDRSGATDDGDADPALEEAVDGSSGAMTEREDTSDERDEPLAKRGSEE